MEKTTKTALDRHIDRIIRESQQAAKAYEARQTKKAACADPWNLEDLYAVWDAESEQEYLKEYRGW